MKFPTQFLDSAFINIKPEAVAVYRGILNRPVALWQCSGSGLFGMAYRFFQHTSDVDFLREGNEKRRDLFQPMFQHLPNPLIRFSAGHPQFRKRLIPSNKTNSHVIA